LFLDLQSLWVSSTHLFIGSSKLWSNVVFIKTSLIYWSRNKVSSLCFSPMNFLSCCDLFNDSIIISTRNFAPKLKFFLCHAFCDWFFSFYLDRTISKLCCFDSFFDLFLKFCYCVSFFTLAFVRICDFISFIFFKIFVEHSSLLIHFWHIKPCFCFIIIESWLFVSYSSLFKECFDFSCVCKTFFHYNAKSQSYKWLSLNFFLSLRLHIINISNKFKSFLFFYFLAWF